MPRDVRISSQRQTALEELLAERLYEFNSEATGIFDGELLSACVEDASGNTIAGLSGHTWGGCCKIDRVWVEKSIRGSGLGTAVMKAAEAEAIRRGCHQMVLSTHSFQAPAFYEKLGFRRVAAIADNPRGHATFFYVKRLPASQGS